MTYTESARAQLDALQVKDHVRILALETSCDETAAAIIENGRTMFPTSFSARLTFMRSMAASFQKSPAARTSKPATA